MISRKLTIANDDIAGPMDDGAAAPDHVQPFMLESSQLRGRIVRLPSVMNAIIAAHAYPAPIAKLLGEALCLTTLLAGMLKFEGVFTLQIKGKGVLKTLVCDMTNDGVLRGYVGYDKDAALSDDFQTLTHGGYLAFTVDQVAATDRYQGIVTLDGPDLTACVLNYFKQSEQISTGFIAHIAQDKNNVWTGGAIMLQQLAREGGIAHGEATEDDWQRSMMLMQTLKQEELLDAATPLNTLLYRLFHEEGVRVFNPITIRKGCRCSPEKIQSVMNTLSDEDKAEYAENGVISVTCEFCNATYSFPIARLTE